MSKEQEVPEWVWTSDVVIGWCDSRGCEIVGHKMNNCRLALAFAAHLRTPEASREAEQKCKICGGCETCRGKREIDDYRLGHVVGAMPCPDCQSPPTVAERLIVRLRAEFPQFRFDIGARVIRTYAKRPSLECGAWRWQVEDGRLYPAIGSQYTMTEILRAEKITRDNDGDGNWFIEPADEPRRPKSRKSRGGAR